MKWTLKTLFVTALALSQSLSHAADGSDTQNAFTSSWFCLASVEGPWHCQSGPGQLYNKTLSEVGHAEQAHRYALQNRNFEPEKSLPQGDSWTQMVEANPEWLTVQLVAVNKQSSLNRLKEKYPELKQGVVIPVGDAEKDWTVLVYGLYRTAAEAKQAMQQAPLDSLQNLRPWIRPMSDLLPHMKNRNI